MFTKVTLTYARMSVLCEDHTGGTSSRGERRENEASVMGKRIYGALRRVTGVWVCPDWWKIMRDIRLDVYWGEIKNF